MFKRPVTLAREPRADRYGIRLAVAIDGEPLKMEIVSEGRITLTGIDDPALPVARLCDVDLVAEKLLANADRFLDDGALGRDVIDLSVLEHTLGGLPDTAWTKATEAYGPSVLSAWKRGLRRLRDRPDQLSKWLQAMGVSDAARAVVQRKLVALPDDAPL